MTASATQGGHKNGQLAKDYKENKWKQKSKYEKIVT